MLVLKVKLIFGGRTMKTIIIMLLMSLALIADPFARYHSEFGLGFGVGLPTGYEARLIYRPSDWFSLSLNYNQFQIQGVKVYADYQGENDDGDEYRFAGFEFVGDYTFSTPGIMLHYHPFGGKTRLTAGFLWDMSKIEIRADGDIEIELASQPDPLDLGISGKFNFKYGERYPYLGWGYGYDYKSAIRIDFSAGVYLIKSPKINIDLRARNQADLETFLAELVEGLDEFDDLLDGFDEYTTYLEMAVDIIEEIGNLGGNLLDIGIALNNVAGINLPALNSKAIEKALADDFNSIYDMSPIPIPKIAGYNILPVISIGFTVFLF